MRASRWISTFASLRSQGVFGSFVGAVVMSLAAVVLLAASAPAADYTWSGGTGGTWDATFTNWTGASGNPWDITNGPLNKAIFSTSGDSSILSGTVYPSYIQATTTTSIGNAGVAANNIGYAADGNSKTIEAATGTTTAVNANINYGGAGTTGNILNVRGGGTVQLSGAANLVLPTYTNTTSSYFSIEQGSTLEVTTGGYLATQQTSTTGKGSSASTMMGASSGSNTLRIGGTSGKLVTGNFNVGSSGNNNNNVYITAPGSWVSGAFTGATPNTWTLFGDSAQLNLNSSNNYVEVGNGAFVQQISSAGTGAWCIGNGSGQNGNQLKITGLGSTILRSSSNYLMVGGNNGTLAAGTSGGSNNSVVVAAGGLLVSGRTGAGYGNDTITTANNYFLITGTSDGTSAGTPSYYRQSGGATSTNSTNVHFLVGGSALATGNSFRVEAGARVDIYGSGTGKNLGVGMVAGANNNYVKVTGSGSTLNFITGQELTVGGNGSLAGGSDCRIDIGNGGSLIMGNSNNTIPLPASVSWATWAANPTSGTSLVLAGTNAAVNLGDGQALALLKVGAVNNHVGVELAAASSRLNFNNGRLVADTTGNLVSGSGQVNLAGPAYISNTDTTTGNIISSLISGTGSLTKEGAGLLTLNNASNAYLGDTTISAGTLKITTTGTPWLSDLANVSVASGALLNLNFTGTDTINALYLGGVQVTQTGTYGSSQSSATFKDDTYFVGTGVLNVSAAPVPEPQTLALLGAGLAAAAVLQRRRRRA